MKKIIYFHIGYGKAGSTYLQNLFFSNNKFNPIHLRNRARNPLIINKNSIQKIKSSYIKKKINVISDETFTSPFSQKSLDIFKRLDYSIKLLKKFFDIKFIVVIRNQKNWYISRYSQNPLKFLYIDKKFYSYKNAIKKIFEPKNIKKIEKIRDNNNYYKMMMFLKKRVKKENFKFLVFEDLAKNEKFFLKELEIFLKKKNIFNKGIKKIDKNIKYETQKIKNYYLPKIKFNKFFFLVKNSGLILTIKIFFFNKFLLPNLNDNAYLIHKFYFSSNKKISILINKNLKKYNYF